jgi:hypothetical protein
MAVAHINAEATEPRAGDDLCAHLVLRGRVHRDQHADDVHRMCGVAQGCEYGDDAGDDEGKT